MKIRGNTSELSNEAVVVRQREARTGATGSPANGTPTALGRDGQDQVRISQVTNEINTQANASQIKTERDKKVEELKARIQSGQYLTPGDELAVKFIEGLAEHNSFFAGVDLSGDE
jgi:flagellar biosynthesis anti-sigma factor FlgM